MMLTELFCTAYHPIRKGWLQTGALSPCTLRLYRSAYDCSASVCVLLLKNILTFSAIPTDYPTHTCTTRDPSASTSISFFLQESRVTDSNWLSFCNVASA